MSNPIFYAAPEQLAALVPGDQFLLDGPEGRHAATVKRLTAGEPVDMCDGAGLRLVCTVTSADKASLTVRVDSVVPEGTPAIPFTLVQALAKGDRDELAIETATELGIDAVVPWQAERSIVRWKMDKAIKGPEKWRQVVAAGAKQARRSAVPQVGSLVGTTGVCELIAEAGLALILHEDAVDSLATVAREWLAAEPDEALKQRGVVMIVGPEGGMSSAEVDAFRAAGARTALLGHHVLRSSTAGPAAVVVLSQELGRWQ